VKKSFVLVTKPEDLGESEVNYRICVAYGQGRKWVKQCRRQQRQQCRQQYQQQRQEQRQERQEQRQQVRCARSSNQQSPLQTPFVQTPVKQATVLAGPSIVKGAKVEAGSRLFPVWEVRNSANAVDNSNAMDAGLWTDVRLRPRQPNVFQVDECGVEVPILEPGVSGIVSLNVTAPLVSEPTAVTAEFEFVDGQGNVFGETLVLSVVVEPSKATDSLVPLANETELVERLQLMGFSDQSLCIQALRKNNGDLNATALTLLRTGN
jgi:hypothetical protein